MSALDLRACRASRLDAGRLLAQWLHDRWPCPSARCCADECKIGDRRHAAAARWRRFTSRAGRAIGATGRQPRVQIVARWSVIVRHGWTRIARLRRACRGHAWPLRRARFFVVAGCSGDVVTADFF
ncbi:hypothetical protein F511_43713 [Dorcoceras hygrometricum]|uniref:Uncharacterized protein n=1 Tax=Dorcoceras hygrometricum TaxID=472368 RepID=A0A2Z7BB58_9LAMI|nr:hypothetical protein F511_43713 [Dorcoceras hygrometricum]